MGLDMYLRASCYVPGGDYASQEECDKYKKIAEAVALAGEYVPLPWLTVEVNVAYWRKANAIHGWFVDNVQEGIDNCQSYYVPREKLVQLRDLCAKVLSEKENPVAAGRSLAPREGFFFGSYEIDDWYWRDIESTMEQIDRVLDIPERYDFYYQSSW